VFAQSIANGIRWEEVDPEIDWMKFHRGITNVRRSVGMNCGAVGMNCAATIFRRRTTVTKTGAFDYCFPDTHNATTGNYGGLCLFLLSAIRGTNHLLPVGPRSRGGKGKSSYSENFIAGSLLNGRLPLF